MMYANVLVLFLNKLSPVFDLTDLIYPTYVFKLIAKMKIIIRIPRSLVVVNNLKI